MSSWTSLFILLGIFIDYDCIMNERRFRLNVSTFFFFYLFMFAIECVMYVFPLPFPSINMCSLLSRWTHLEIIKQKLHLLRWKHTNTHISICILFIQCNGRHSLTIKGISVINGILIMNYIRLRSFVVVVVVRCLFMRYRHDWFFSSFDFHGKKTDVYFNYSNYFTAVIRIFQD